MSRIHEALKKAEQERAAAQGGTLPGPGAVPPFDGHTSDNGNGVAIESLDGRTLNGVPMGSMGQPVDPYNIEARCAQYDWHPDPSTMLFLNGDNLRGTEEFRTLRTRLYHLREKAPLKKVLITSALPNEGKSFTAANLAQVMVRQHGRRALLIDADLRGPRLHLMLGTQAGPGLTDYLQGVQDEFSIMQRGPLQNLYFIPSGSSIEDPAELVGSERLKLLMQRLEPLFDWIIVDSPPAIAVSDASVLAKACDGVLIVVRSNVTPADAARRAREEFPDEALLGVVLNGTEEKPTPYARYYYEAYQNAEKPNKG